MTYQSKRAREILAATAKPHDPLSSKSSTTITACTFASEAASQPTKKQAMQSPLPPLPEVVLNDKWGPFFPPNTTTKCAQPPPNNLGPIWKKPPTRSTSSSVKEDAKDLSGYQKKNQPKLASMVSPNMPPNIPYSISPNSLSSRSTSSPTTHRPLEHSQPLERGSQNLDTGAVKTSVAASHNWQKIGQKIAQESKEIPKKSKSLRAKSLPDWPQNIDFDDKEEVLTIDSKGNNTLVSGTVLPIDVWSNNGVKYFVEFNDLCQPIRKGGHILIRFIGMMAKMETHCPEDEHGEKMSLLALWIKSHMGKDRRFLSGTDTADFVDDVKAKVEQLRLKYPTKSELELENEAFEETMYHDEIPDRPLGYGLGVKKGDIYGVRGVLRKEGYGKVQRRNIVMDSVKQEMTALHKRNDVLEKDNAKMKDQVIGAVRQGKSALELLNCTQELLGLTQQQVID
ncbi:Otolith matrix protein 1 [Bienertia sinuspersici]